MISVHNHSIWTQIRKEKKWGFLGAYKHLYKRVCPSSCFVLMPSICVSNFVSLLPADRLCSPDISAAIEASFCTVGCKRSSRSGDFERRYLRSYPSHCAQIWRACSYDHPLCAYQFSCCSDHAFSIEQGSGLPSCMCFRLTVPCNFNPRYLSFPWSDWAEIWRGCSSKRPLDVQQSSSLSSSPFLNYPSRVRKESGKVTNALLSSRGDRGQD